MAALGQAVHLLRRLTSELRSAILGAFGLLAAIEERAQAFHKRSGVHCEMLPGADEQGLDL